MPKKNGSRWIAQLFKKAKDELEEAERKEQAARDCQLNGPNQRAMNKKRQAEVDAGNTLPPILGKK